jgi:nitrogen fixation NifU-like protein
LIAYPDDLITEARHPAGAGALDGANRHARGSYPRCGDDIEIAVREEDGMVIDVGHHTRGCAFAVASASILVRSVRGGSVAHALELGACLERDLGGTAELPWELRVLASVRVYPARIRCALIPWQALRSALTQTA